MNGKEKQHSEQISQIMRSTRKYRGLTQTDISKALGITQGTLSKLEQGTLVISTPLWFEFCSLTKISPRSFLLGYVDQPLPEALSLAHETKDDSLFKLPKRYNFSKGSSVRSLRGILDYAKKSWGEKKFSSFIDHVEMDPDFFVILPNQINLQFTYDLLDTLKTSGHLNKDDYKKLALPFSRPEFHGSVGKVLEQSQNIKELIKGLFKNADAYQTNFRYEFEVNGSEVTIKGKPESFIAAFTPTKDAARNLCEVKAQGLEATLKISNQKSSKVRHTHCFFNGDSACQFVIQI